MSATSDSISPAPVKTGSVAGRRKLHFDDLDAVVVDAESVTARPGKTLGNWSSAQILDHLANSIAACFNGPQVQAPLFVRWIVGPLVRRRMLSRGMPAGFTLPRQMSHFMPGDDAQVATSLGKLRTWTERLKVECPPLRHPAFGQLSHVDWIRLHLRHAELHLSFIVPDDASAIVSQPS